MSKTEKAVVLHTPQRFKAFYLSWQQIRREIAKLEKELAYSLISLSRLRQKIPAL